MKKFRPKLDAEYRAKERERYARMDPDKKERHRARSRERIARLRSTPEGRAHLIKLWQRWAKRHPDVLREHRKSSNKKQRGN